MCRAPGTRFVKYVVDKDSDAVITDLKKTYHAATVAEAEEALESFAQAWDDKYPTIVKQWRLKWSDIVAMFDFSPAIREAIYTTNAIESVNSVIRLTGSTSRKNRRGGLVGRDREYLPLLLPG